MQFHHLILGPLGLATLMIVGGVALDFVRQWLRRRALGRESKRIRKGDDLGHRDAHPGTVHVCTLLRADRRMRPPFDRDNGGPAVLTLTGILTIAALFYLGYAMIRPERF